MHKTISSDVYELLLCTAPIYGMSDFIATFCDFVVLEILHDTFDGRPLPTLESNFHFQHMLSIFEQALSIF